jgi:pyruvate,orthophosphate dikinase
MSKFIYHFKPGFADGGKELKKILGNKGVGLAEMSKLGIAVPPGFTISAQVPQSFSLNDETLPVELKKLVYNALDTLGKNLSLGFGDKKNPLLLSVRSGASVSMPGMMETILNLGLNDETVKGFAAVTGDLFFAYDCYRRFIEMYSHVVLGIEKNIFQNLFDNHKQLYGLDKEKDLQALIKSYYELIESNTGEKFSQDLYVQLEKAVLAVFSSWDTDRAVKYREIYSIGDKAGTAVNIQSMVFGNKGEKSATGVVFTRNPSTGDKQIFGEFLPNAQGEDIVAGTITPLPINTVEDNSYLAADEKPLELLMPSVYKELKNILGKLEEYYKDMQDVEFTIDDGKVWILQTRSGKRTIDAAVKIAIDMLSEGLISEKEVLARINPDHLDKILHTSIDATVKKELFSKGLPASPGATSGRVVFSSERSQVMAAKYKVILVRNETSPEDIGGIDSAAGILTARGGMTSHAAVVARGMGKPCITGAAAVSIDEDAGVMQVNNIKIKEGDHITINGASGEIFIGEIATVEAKVTDHFQKLTNISEKHANLSVRANAETVKDAVQAKSFGCMGIGLCRTEHMFFQKDRIKTFRKMVLAAGTEQQKTVLAELKDYQEQDFYDLFKIMLGEPVTIRLLDPPLHEFLPAADSGEIEYFADAMKISVKDIKERIGMLLEVNPMLGHRGARLAVTFPEIYSMQVEAIFRAACKLKKEGINVVPEIMVPLVMNATEFQYVKALILKTADELFEEIGDKLDFLIGSMVELPAAVMNITDIAKAADFISFGTNDLTQTCLGISRDDSGKFLKDYTNHEIFLKDPFVTIEKSVKNLVSMAVQQARAVKPDIKIGICGEHAGDPESIEFFVDHKFDYISCSPFRVPVAKVASARFSNK